MGCVRMLAFWVWRALAAALLAALLARIDQYVETSGKTGTPAGRAWRYYRDRTGKKVKRGTPPGASDAIDTKGRPLR